MPSPLVRGALCAAALFASRPVAAAEPCPGPLDPASVVRCALAASPEVSSARAELDAVEARRITAAAPLPSYPVLAVSAGGRWAGAETGVNAYGSLSQELEIGGQRRARLDEVDAGRAAALRRVAVTENEIAAQALRLLTEFSSATEEARLATSWQRAADELAAYAEGRVREQLMAPLDADLLRAEAVALRRMAFSAERRLTAARRALSSTLALPIDALPQATTPVVPLAVAEMSDGALTERALTVRGELGAAQAERQALEAQTRRLERERVPNLTLTLNAGLDGFGEVIAGGGVTWPLPVLGALGPTRSGAIAETQARVRQADEGLEALRRRLSLEVLQASAEYRIRLDESRLYTPALLEAARYDLTQLRAHLADRSLAVRDALTAERALIDLLEQDLAARTALSLASIDLTRAAALQWPGANP